MTFQQALNYLNGTVGEGSSRRHPNRLDRMRHLLRELGEPQDRYPTVHVGGTSGKGSTATMAASILSASGKRTGLHTKPHLESITERARIDGAPIAQERFAEVLEEMMPALDATAQAHERPTYYETLLALAFAYFAEEHVDAAVIEVGVGGRLDGTNVLRPAVCAITNVGLDHTEILGDTHEAIAADKAGIAKPGTPLVSAVDHPGARAAIEAACRDAGAPFFPVLDLTRIENVAATPTGQTFALVTPADRYEVALPLAGEFQRRNAATAVLMLEQLPAPLRPSRESIESGLAQTRLQGRMEVFATHPAVVFDVAHNADKAAHLAASLREAFGERRYHFVVAVAESKDAAAILRALADLPATFLFTSFSAEGKTAIRPQRLAAMAESAGLWGRAQSDPREALTIARRNAGADDVVVVTGSTFLVSELREWWMEHVVAGS